MHKNVSVPESSGNIPKCYWCVDSFGWHEATSAVYATAQCLSLHHNLDSYRNRSINIGLVHTLPFEYLTIKQNWDISKKWGTCLWDVNPNCDLRWLSTYIEHLQNHDCFDWQQGDSLLPCKNGLCVTKTLYVSRDEVWRKTWITNI